MKLTPRWVSKSLLLVSLITIGMGFPRLAVLNAEPVAKVTQVQGEVFVRASGAAAEAWQPINQDTDVSNGDSVRTKNGSCQLVYTDQASFALGPNTGVTAQEKTETQDVVLEVGKLSAKINHEKAVKPFQVVTPTAVAAVRGTDVIFDFNESGQLTMDLQDGGPLHVYNDEAEMALELAGKKKLIIQYNKETGILMVQNDCSSDGQVTFSVQGTEYAENPCDKQEIPLETAVGVTTNTEPPPDTNEPPDTHGNSGP